jgi:hypothetical protein
LLIAKGVLGGVRNRIAPRLQNKVRGESLLDDGFEKKRAGSEKKKHGGPCFSSLDRL